MKRHFPFLAIHVVAIPAAVWIAFLLRFDFAVPLNELPHLYFSWLLFLPVKLIIFYGFNLPKKWWRIVGMSDLIPFFLVNTFASIVTGAITLYTVGRAFPRSIYLLDLCACFFLSVAIPVFMRLYRNAIRGALASRLAARDVLICGAGEAGIALIQEIRRNPLLGYRCAGFLDDDINKRDRTLLGLHVLGTCSEVNEVLTSLSKRGIQISEIILAMPSATGRQLRVIETYCRSSGIPVKIVPGIHAMLSGRVSVNGLRDVKLHDLLGRESVRLDEGAIERNVRNRSVLVTGGAGSIGSELCRQIASYQPRVLVIFDQAESDLFMIDRELRMKFPDVFVAPVVGDICNFEHMEATLLQYQVESIYHAAAYKHVPLMETNILEAVRNNILGTYNVALAAQNSGVSRFLMISSDKAVNPTSVMGMTKRCAEVILSAMSREAPLPATTFVSVRFGNVLGSKGSVIPVFEQQIAAGGPVTVTHPEMRRYFMTIPEAVQLVLQAETMGQGAEVFVLDMGEPIRILDLAENLIKLVGLIPNEDIEIQFTGVRSGEKLFEEIHLTSENMRTTLHEKIKIFQCKSLPLDEVIAWLDELRSPLATADTAAVLQHLRIMVPEYMATAPAKKLPAPNFDRLARAS